VAVFSKENLSWARKGAQRAYIKGIKYTWVRERAHSERKMSPLEKRRRKNTP